MSDVFSLSINHFRFIDHFVHQFESLGFGSRKSSPRKHQFACRSHAATLHHERRNGGRRDAQLHFGKGKFRVDLGNHDVGGCRNAVATANAGAVDIGNDRLVAEINGLEQIRKPFGIVEILVAAVGRHLLHVVQIGAGAKRLAISFNNNDTDVVATVQPTENLGKFGNHGGIHGVAHFRTIQINPCHALAELYL